MNGLRACVVLLSAVAAAASATSYQEKGAVFGNGYSETDLGGGRFTIDFHGNGFTDLSDAVAYAHRRAGELCPRGYDELDSHAIEDGKKPDVVLTVRCR